MKKNKGVQVMAFLALFGIVASVIGTGLLVIFGGSISSHENSLTNEQYIELQKYLDSQSGAVIENNTGSGIIIEEISGSGAGLIEDNSGTGMIK